MRRCNLVLKYTENFYELVRSECPKLLNRTSLQKACVDIWRQVGNYIIELKMALKYTEVEEIYDSLNDEKAKFNRIKKDMVIFNFHCFNIQFCKYLSLFRWN